MFVNKIKKIGMILIISSCLISCCNTQPKINYTTNIPLRYEKLRLLNIKMSTSLDKNIYRGFDKQNYKNYVLNLNSIRSHVIKLENLINNYNKIISEK